jgi:TonB family protein
MSVRYKRNFVIATILHIAIIAGVVLWENFLGGFGRPALASVALYVPADILGDLPKGEGYGRGNYKPPEPAGGDTSTGPSELLTPPDETRAPQPKAEANDVLIPKKTTSKKLVTESKPAANAKPAITKKPGTVAKAKTTTGTGKGSSADDIKNRFAKALTAAEDGTPYGDGKKAGGGSGKGRIGSPTGSPDGVVGGVGQGSANWKYFEHVHDVMYEAWVQPGSALDRKLIATVQLLVARDGSITDVSLRIPSGNKVMDDSVLSAARKVQRLEPPPDNLVRGDAASITVDFQVEG